MDLGNFMDCASIAAGIAVGRNLRMHQPEFEGWGQPIFAGVVTAFAVYALLSWVLVVPGRMLPYALLGAALFAAAAGWIAYKALGDRDDAIRAAVATAVVIFASPAFLFSPAVQL